MDEKTGIRAFIAMPLCKATLDDIALAQQRLNKKIKGIRITATRNIHLTLHFFGQIAPKLAMAVMERVENRVSELQAFKLHIQGLGAFPASGRARVLWLGISQGEEGVRNIAHIVMDAVDAQGLQREHKPFKPHITIARAKKRPVDIQDLEMNLNLSPCLMDRVVLFQSRLTPRGPVYTALKECLLPQK